MAIEFSVTTRSPELLREAIAQWHLHMASSYRSQARIANRKTVAKQFADRAEVHEASAKFITAIIIPKG